MCNRLLPPSLVPFWLILLFPNLVVMNLLEKLGGDLGLWLFATNGLPYAWDPSSFHDNRHETKRAREGTESFAEFLPQTIHVAEASVVFTWWVSNPTLFFMFTPKIAEGLKVSELTFAYFSRRGWFSNHQACWIFGTSIAGPFWFDSVTWGGHSWYHASSSCIRGMAAEWKLEWFLGFFRDKSQHQSWPLGPKDIEGLQVSLWMEVMFIETFPVVEKNWLAFSILWSLQEFRDFSPHCCDWCMMIRDTVTAASEDK